MTHDTAHRSAIEHASRATELLDEIEPGIGKAIFVITPVHLSAAQVHATLAVAFATLADTLSKV